MELDELIAGTPAPPEQVVEGVLVVRAGERYARVDGQSALWGPLVGADHLAPDDELVLAQTQDGTPFVIWPAEATGGEPGPMGPQGVQGPTGPAGPQGNPGPTGQTGAQGPKGDTGATGTTGSQGPAGATGSQGPQGVKGDTGATGSQGPQGVQGATGTTGAQGTPGEKWFTQAGAPAGATGIVGDWALDSSNGDYYEKTGASTWTIRGSLRGPTGATGSTGTQGPQGVQGPTGNTGSTGSTGAPGTPGSVWRSGAGAPATGLGVIGDWYLNTTDGGVYEKTAAAVWTLRDNLTGPTGATGSTGSQGVQGPQGTTGSTGSTGAPGAPGSVWRSGAGAPAGGLGIVGDWYLNTTDGSVHEKTGSSTWTLRDNLTGPQGAQGATGATGSQGPQGATGTTGATGSQGATGATGAAGAVWRSGTGAPSPTLGAVGDWYLDDATGNVYERTS